MAFSDGIWFRESKTRNSVAGFIVYYVNVPKYLVLKGLTFFQSLSGLFCHVGGSTHRVMLMGIGFEFKP
jgi:hypothetical protein